MRSDSEFGVMLDFFYPGQIVTLKSQTGKYANEIFKITKVKQKNMDVERQDGSRLTGDQRLFVKTDQKFVGVEKPPVVRPRKGAIVRCTMSRTGKFNYPQNQLFAVIHVSDDRANIVPIGGGNGTYWRMPFDHITIVDPSTVTAP